MGVGLEIFSEAGSLQVSSEQVSFGVSAYGTVILRADNMSHPQPQVVGSISVTGDNPLLATRCLTGSVSVERVSNSGSSYTFYLRAQASGSLAVQYWVYDTAAKSLKDPTLTSAGVQVFDDFNVLTFDAAMPVMRVVDIIDITMPQAIPGFNGGYNGGAYQTTQDIYVPSGKTYAVIQCNFAYLPTMYDTGNYIRGGNTNPGDVPITLPPDGVGDTGPPSNATYREMNLETYHSSAGNGFNPSNVISVGLKRFEFFRGWYPIGQQPHADPKGLLRFLVVDVTNFLAGSEGNINSPKVNANSTQSQVSVQGDNVTSSTPPVTISISGGTPPYSIRWERVGGTSTVEASGASNTTSFNTITYGQPAGTTRQAIYRVRVMDAAGNAGYSQDILFSHVTVAADYIPDNVAPFPVMNLSSNDPDVSWNVGTVRQVTGINQPINLRVERYGYSGNLSALYVDVFTSTASANGPWTHHGFFSAHAAGTQYLDLPSVTNGTWVTYAVHAITDSGKRSGSVDIVVWNLSNPGGSAQWTANGGNSFTVDADDNYNKPDFTPDPIPAIQHFTPSTTNDTAYGAPRVFQITGINQTINLQFRRGNESLTGNVSKKNLTIKTGPSSTGPWETRHVTTGNGNYNFTVTNNMWIELSIEVSTSSGKATMYWDNQLINLNDGNAVLASFYLNGVVDSDDDFNNADYTPDPKDWGNISFTSTQSTGAGSNQATTPNITISGINRPINIRATITSSSSTFSASNLHFVKNGTIVSNASGTGVGYWCDATINNGDTVFFYVDGSAADQRRTLNLTVEVKNITTGVVLDTFTVSGVLLSDLAPADYDPDPINPPAMSVYSNADSAYSADSTFRITGITRPITLRFTRGNQVDGGGIFTRRWFIYHSKDGSNWTEYFVGTGSSTVIDIPVTNGDYFIMRIWLTTNSGIGTTSFTCWIDNLTTGARLATVNAGGTIDADDNFNKPSLVIDPLNFGAANFTTNDNTGAGSNASRTVSGNTQSVNLRFTLTSISHNFDGGDFYVYKNGVRSRGANGFGLGYWTDVDVVAGDQLYFYYDGYTGSGRRTLNGVITVQNTSAPGGWQPLGTFSLAGVLDNDNNWNVPDYTPDPIAFGNMDINTNDNLGWSNTSGLVTITGINQPTKIHVGISSRTGGVDAGSMFVVKNGQAVLALSTANGGTNEGEFTVVNGDSFYLHTSAETYSGRKQASFTVGLHNASTGYNVIGSSYVTIVVDANNDYNIVDQVLDPLPYWSYYSYDSGGNNYAEVKPGVGPITGINTPTVLRMTISNYSGNLNSGFSTAWYNSQPQGTVSSGNGFGNGSVQFTVNNGGYIEFQHGGSNTAYGTSKYASYLVTITNVSTGGNTIAQWQVDGSVGYGIVA